ncbi:hypothetical protein HDV05_008030 [Chytridiales sp. JEL 0842]|nr:hypothetical protein HDV05_008030 [Chytridiales sp. JEL 0842]
MSTSSTASQGGSSACPVTILASHAVLDKKDTLSISLQAEPFTQRTGIDVVCVIDLSGSMDSLAALSGSNTSNEGPQLTTLDLVKHAVKAVIHSLGPQDRLGLVSFSDGAKVEFALEKMDTPTKERAQSTLEALRTQGCTNIWAGVDAALGVFENAQSLGGRLGVTLVFTDGQPNVRPPLGEAGMLLKRKEKKWGGTLPCVLHTFGFGYDLDSVLLKSLADVGGGMFAFIPDAGFVGTVFVDAVAGCVCVGAKDVKVNLKLLNGAEVLLPSECKTLGGFSVSVNGHDDPPLQQLPTSQSGSYYGSNGTISTISTTCLAPMSVGPQGLTLSYAFIPAGQARDFVLHFSKLPPVGTPYAQITVECIDPRATPTGVQSAMAKMSAALHISDGAKMRNKVGRSETVHIVELRNQKEVAGKVAVEHMRLKSVDVLLDSWALAASSSFTQSQETLKAHIADCKKVLTKLKASPSDSALAKRFEGLVVDLEGQALEALEEMYFNKWGKHYLLSLSGAHKLQQCNNFKDPGVQFYTSPLFEEVRDELNELFVGLPPPKASGYGYGGRGGGYGAGAPAPGGAPPVYTPVDMRRYHDAGNPWYVTRISTQSSKSNPPVYYFVLSTISIGPNSLIHLSDGTVIPISKLNKSHTLRTSLSDPTQISKIRCIVYTRFPTPRRASEVLLKLPTGLLVTPKHPCRLPSQSGTCAPPSEGWEHPLNVDGVETLSSEKWVEGVYSIVLEKGSFAFVANGTEVLSMGHGLSGNEVVEHDYLGTERVVEDLKRMKGWEAGKVVCEGVKRDTKGTGWIVGMVEWRERRVVEARI